jgi:hypothetical protein
VINDEKGIDAKHIVHDDDHDDEEEEEEEEGRSKKKVRGEHRNMSEEQKIERR